MSHPFTTIWSDVFKALPNYPSHPPMPGRRTTGTYQRGY